MDNGALHREFAYYRMNQSALVRRYKGKYLVIVGETVVSDHETDLEAYPFRKSLPSRRDVFSFSIACPEKRVTRKRSILASRFNSVH